MNATVQSMNCTCGNTIAFVAVDSPIPLICPSCRETVVSSTVPDSGVPATDASRIFGAARTEDVEPGWASGSILCDNIEVLGCVGMGGMGRVYRVRNHAWDVDLAVKCPNKRVLAYPGGIEHIERECETWVNLGLHAHLVTCYYVRHIDHIPCIFTEFVASGDLGRGIRSRRLYHGTGDKIVERILRLMIQSAWGLQFAHAQGIAHLDIKPSNILISTKGRAKLTDLGLANPILAGEKTIRGTGGMTPPYGAPEQFANKPVGFATDIWSLAVTLLEMFVCEVKWEIGPAAPEYLEALVAGDLPGENNLPIPPGVLALLRRCFRKKPEKRLNSAGEFADELVDCYQALYGRTFPVARPDNVPARVENSNNRAISLWDLGKRTDAEQLWAAILRKHPGHFESTYNLALEQWRSGKLTDENLLRRIEGLPASSEQPEAVMDALRDIHIERGVVADAVRLAGFPDEAGDAGPAEPAAEYEEASRLCLRRQSEHLDAVTAVALSPDRRVAFTSSRDNSVRRWNLASGASTHVLAGHRTAVLGVILSEDGTVCVSYDTTGVVRVWRAADGADLGRFTGAWEHVAAVAMASNAKQIAVLSYHNKVFVLDLDTGNTTSIVDGPPGQIRLGAMSRDASTAAVVQDGTKVVVWQVGSGRSIRTVGSFRSEISAIRVSANGRQVIWGDHEGSVRLVDASSENVLELKGHRGHVSGVTLLTQTNQAVTVGVDGAIRLWELQSTRCLATMKSSSSHYASIACDPDGDFAVAGTVSGDLDFWRLSSGLTFRAAPFRLSRGVDVESSQSTELQYQDALTRAERSITQNDVHSALRWTLAARNVPGCDRRPDVMRLWFELYARSNRVVLNDAWEAAEIHISNTQITSIAHLPRSPRFVLGDSAGGVYVYDLTDGKITEAPFRHTGAAARIETDYFGHKVVTGGSGNQCFVWLCSENRFCELPLHTAQTSAISLSPDGAFLASVDWEIRIHRVSPGGGTISLTSLTDQASAIRWLPDASALLVAAGESILVYDIARGTIETSLMLRPYQITSIAVSPDGRYVLVAGETLGTGRGLFVLWDIKNQSIVQRNENLPGVIQGFSFLADGRHYILATTDGAVTVRHVDSEDSVKVLGGASLRRSQLFGSKDGRYAYAVFGDGTVRIWSLDWDLDIDAPLDATERMSSMGECNRKLRDCLSLLQKRVPTADDPADDPLAAPTALPSLRRRMEDAGLGALSENDLKRAMSRRRWWYRRGNL